MELSGGLTVSPGDTLLVERARDYLAAGPSDVVPLVEHICQLPGAPRVVAEHLAEVLFGGRREFVREADGRWRLTSAPDARLAPAAPLPGHDPLASLSYVVVDVETTGGRPHAGDRITEIAAVVVRDGEVREVYETLVNPQRPIPPFITQLTNISWDMVKDAPTFRDVCPRVLETLGGHVFVAHNASFDWRFVTMEVARATGEQLDGRRLCTVRLARRILPQLRSRSLDSVTNYFGIEIGARHRAAGDAVATAHVLLRLLHEARGQGISTWGELQLLLSTPARRTTRRRRSALPTPIDKDTTA